jgi:hypothetical protein
MTIEHSNISDPNLHEPKGVSTAASDTLYVGNGAGSGDWKKLPITALEGVVGDGVEGQVITSNGAGGFAYKWATAYGYVYYTNIASPTVITYPSTYTKVNVATSAGGAIEVTEGTTARLTYIGTDDRNAIITASISVSHTHSSAVDLRLSLYKNGVLLTNSEVIETVVNAEKNRIDTFVNTSCSTNDYFEAYVMNAGAAGDVNIHTFKMGFEGI